MPRYHRLPASEDGWIHIPPSSRWSPKRRPSLRSSSPPPVLGDIEPRLATARRRVKETPALEPIFSAVESVRSKTQRLVLLGLGHVSTAASLYQLALALEVLERLPQVSSMRIWDPVFSDEEKGFLAAMPRVVVSEDEQQRNGGLVLLAPHLEFEVLQAVLPMEKGVTALICNDLGLAGMKDLLGEGWEEEVVKETPECAQGRAFNHLAVYWREQTEIQGRSGLGELNAVMQTNLAKPELLMETY